MVYITNLPRGPIGKIRRTLSKSLPPSAILNISFIGNTVTEILCHKPLVPRLIATFKLLRFTHLRTYDPTIIVGRKDDDPLAIKYRAACYHRWTNAAKKTISEVCAEWYTSKAQGLLVAYPKISESTPFVRAKKSTTDKEKDTMQEQQADSSDSNKSSDQQELSKENENENGNQ